jgi:amino acid transporter
MEFMVVLSIGAAALGVHNATARYFFAMGREGLLPRRLGRAHPRFNSPHLGSLTQVVLAVLIVYICAASGADPYLKLSPAFSGIGTLGIVLLQCGAALAAVVHFARKRDRRIIRTMIAPGLGAIGLATVSVMMLLNYGSVTGLPSGWQNELPWALPLIAVAAAVWAVWMGKNQPAKYARIGRGMEEANYELASDDPIGHSSLEIHSDGAQLSAQPAVMPDLGAPAASAETES